MTGRSSGHGPERDVAATVPRPGRHPAGRRRRSRPRCSRRAGRATTIGGAVVAAAKSVHDLELDRATSRTSRKKDFAKATGIDLTYTEDINDNNEYFAKIRPNLSQGRRIGTDGFVLTDWMANRMINQVEVGAAARRGRVPEQVEPARRRSRTRTSIPTRESSRAVGERRHRHRVQHRDHGQGDQARSTTSSRSRAPRRCSPRCATPSASSCWPTGKSIANPTYAEAAAAFDRLEKALNDGEIDGVNGNEYVNDLGAGNLAPRSRWSGDVAQITLDNPDMRVRGPGVGRHAVVGQLHDPDTTTDNRRWRREWINFFYDPANAAVLTATIQYISPVDGVAEELTKMGGEAAALVDNPLVVPDDDVPRAGVDLRYARPERKRCSSTSGSPRSPARAEPARTARGRTRRPGAQARAPLRRGSLLGARTALAAPVLLLSRCSRSCGCRCRRAPTGSRTRSSTGTGRTSTTRSRTTTSSSSGRSSTRCAATLLALVIGYPLAYVIAFRGGRWRNVLLGLVVVPFFTNFLIRTLAWKTILGDQGSVVGDPAHDRRPRSTTGTAAAHALRGDRRSHLQLPAVHGAADLRRAREDRPPPRRRGAGPVLEHLAGVPQGGVPALAAGRVRRAACSCSSPRPVTSSTRTTSAARSTTMIGNVVQNQFLVQVNYPVAAGAVLRVHGHRHGDRDRLRASARHRGPRVTAASPTGGPARPTSRRARSRRRGGAVGRWLRQRWPRSRAALPVPADLRDRRCSASTSRTGASTWSGSEFTLDNWLIPFADAGARRRALMLSLEIAAHRDRRSPRCSARFMAIALVRYRFRGGGPIELPRWCSRSPRPRSCSARRC